ncbi:hypothetical protein QYE76_065535 [Lolium multiflorum]|uniref:Uncharacterized protein n=1 Tax=Lolium multiflorum TaxID=4521 RepID=A0AAD8SB43_LOLMU|nr:hypothetical protein QYE76_065535 [Lolium multiflorum]
METESSQEQDAGSSSQASGTNLSEVTRGAWMGSSVSQYEIDWLYRSRRIPEGVSCRIPGDEIEPVLEPGERVVFLAHFERGFGLPVSSFFRDFLDFYKLQPHHLPGNAIFYLSCYVTFMEAYIGIRPTRTFFYVKNTGAADLIDLPPFDPAPPTKTNWSYNPKESHNETNRIIRFMKQRMKDTDLCSDDIIRTFISRRVLPLKRRAHKMSEMYGPGDPTKITGLPLSKKDVVLKARQICQTSMPEDWEWGLRPLSSTNPPTQEAKDRFPRIESDKRGRCRKRGLDKFDPDPVIFWKDLKMGRTPAARLGKAPPEPSDVPSANLNPQIHEHAAPLQAEAGKEFVDKLMAQGQKNKTPASDAGSSQAPPAKRFRTEPVAGKVVAMRRRKGKQMPTATGPALKLGPRPEGSAGSARASTPPPHSSPETKRGIIHTFLTRDGERHHTVFIEVAEETPVTYGDLTGELKKKYDEIKSALEADLIGSFHRTRSHGIRWKGFTPEGALDGVDLSTPSEERTRSLRQEINFMVAHSLHRHSESLVNTLERVALRVIQEIMSHQYSPSGPALGTHQGELLLQSRPPLPFALAAPEAPNSSAYVVYKIGGDPSDYQFLQDAPKEIPHGYACAYVPDCSTWAPSNQVAIAGTSGATGGTSEADPEKQTWLAKYATPTKLPSPAPAVGSEPEKQAWLVKYATPTNLQGSAPAAITADQICTILKDQFGMMPKRKAIGYTKPYPNEYELIPLPPKYRLPDFTKFSGSDGSSSIEHVSRYLAQLGMISASDELRVRYFSQSLTGSAFGWYTSLPPNSIQTWKQLEERFHEQYHSEASEAGIADLAQVRQKRGETEVASQADYPSLAHMVQKLSAYEQRHPDIYQDKFKRVVTMVDAGEDEGPTGEREVAVAEWTRAAGPVTCKWVKPPGPPRGFDFDVTKTEQIFDLLLAEKHIKVPEGHKFPTVQELNGKPYCKWHNTFTHTTNDCRVWRQQIQVAIENGRLIFNQYAMKVDTHPFPAVNMVEFTHLGGCQPDFSANISMVELGHRSEKDGDEDSCSQSKDTEGAAPCDRLRQDGKRYVTEGEVKNIRYQRPLSDHLLNKYVSRVQRLRGLEEAERLYLHTLRKARPDLAAKVQRTLDEEGLPQRKEWRPKQRKADDETSAGTNMVLVRPAKCRAPRSHDAPKVDNSKRTNVIKSEIGLVLSTDMDE